MSSLILQRSHNNVQSVEQGFQGVFSRPGRSQGLLYKQLVSNSLIKSVIVFLPQLDSAATPKRLELVLLVIKIDYVIVILNFLNPERHQNPISISKVTAILLKGWI